jgi:hypothetical protein
MSTPFLICTAVGALALLALGIICVLAWLDTWTLRALSRHNDVPGQMPLFTNGRIGGELSWR